MMVMGILCLFSSLSQATDVKHIEKFDIHEFCNQGRRGVFFGDTGYFINVPEGYTLFPDFVDEDKKDERVVFMPCTLSQELAEQAIGGQFSEEIYKTMGVIILEVSSDLEGLGGSKFNIEDFKKIIANLLQSRGEIFEIKNLSLPLPSFEIEITQPVPLKQVILKGENVIYQFTADLNNEMLNSLVQSLRPPEN